MGSVQARPIGLPLSRNSCCWDAFQVTVCLSLVIRGTVLSEMLCDQPARNGRWSPGQSLLGKSLKTPYPREKVMCKLQSRGAKQLRTKARKGDFKTRKRWFLVLRLTELSTFRLGCSWSSCKKGKMPKRRMIVE